MHTSAGILVLAGFLVGPTASPEIRWLTNYSAAQKLGAETQRPLALVIGKGENGQKQLVTDNEWNEQVQDAFAAGYVCVYLDAERPDNQKLVKELEIRSDIGLVLSDRKGEYQAFHHDGPLPRTELVQHLRRNGRSEAAVLPNSTQSSSPIHRVEYRPANSQYVPSSSYRIMRGGQNC